MKKTILGALLALVIVSPTLTHAQVVQQVELTPSARATLILEIKAELSDLISQLIAQLQIQLVQQLADNQAAVDNLSKKVDVVITNTSGGSFVPTPTPVTPPVVSVVVNANASTHSAVLGQHVTFLPTITGAGDYPTLHLTTDNPDGFMRFGGATGGASATTSDQTFVISATGGSGDIISSTNTAGTFHYTFDVNGTDDIETINVN